MLVALVLAKAFGVVVTDNKHQKVGRECYSDLFYLQYNITDEAFIIEDLKVTVRRRGYGRQIIKLIMSLCEERNLDLYANTVLMDGIVFFRKMGLERDSHDPGNFVRRYQKQAA